MRKLRFLLLITALIVSQFVFGASHREAPIVALDHKADITDVYAFRSYGGTGAGTHVTLIMGVDPLFEPANGPNWFPFDPDILYELKVDNDNDAVEDVVFQFRFATEQRLPNLFQVYAGVPGGAVAPANSPPRCRPAPQSCRHKSIISSVGSGAAPTIHRHDGQGRHVDVAVQPCGRPALCGTRQRWPAHDGLQRAVQCGDLLGRSGIRLFAGTTDDAFWIDLGGAFDTLNTSKSPPVLSAAEDAANRQSCVGYGVGLCRKLDRDRGADPPADQTGAIEPATSTAATIGVWGTTSRPRTTVRRRTLPTISSGSFAQVQRMGNPLINELLVGTGFKDTLQHGPAKNDAQFASFFLDPALARVVNALTAGAVAIPSPPRLDLLPVVTYAPPIAAMGTRRGLLRIYCG